MSSAPAGDSSQTETQLWRRSCSGKKLVACVSKNSFLLRRSLPPIPSQPSRLRTCNNQGRHLIRAMTYGAQASSMMADWTSTDHLREKMGADHGNATGMGLIAQQAHICSASASRIIGETIKVRLAANTTPSATGGMSKRRISRQTSSITHLLLASGNR